MAHRIIAHTRITDPEPLIEIVTEYLTFVTKGFAQASGKQVAPQHMAAQTFENLDAYLPPNGGIWTAQAPDNTLTGIVFLKRIRPDAVELKRLYVRPTARGAGLARRLMEQAIPAARTLGARAILLDTGKFLTASQRLYEKLGFHDIDRYPESENDPAYWPHIRFMQLDL